MDGHKRPPTLIQFQCFHFNLFYVIRFPSYGYAFKYHIQRLVLNILYGRENYSTQIQNSTPQIRSQLLGRIFTKLKIGFSPPRNHRMYIINVSQLMKYKCNKCAVFSKSPRSYLTFFIKRHPEEREIWSLFEIAS